MPPRNSISVMDRATSRRPGRTLAVNMAFNMAVNMAVTLAVTLGVVTATLVISMTAWFGTTMSSVALADGSDDPATTTTDAPTTTSSAPTNDPSDSGGVARPKVEIAVIRVVLAEQKVYVFDASRRLVATLPMSSGVQGQTPVGTFKVFSRSARTFYVPDPTERMDWMVRFTRSAKGNSIGFHSIPYRITNKGKVLVPTPIGESPSSNGCIRLRAADARWLFHNVRMGTRVVVQRTRA